MERRLEINLLPPEFRPQPAIRWHPLYLAALYALSLFLALYVVLTSLDRVKNLQDQVQLKESRIKSLQPFVAAYDQAEQSVKTLDHLKRLFVYLDQHYVDWPVFFHHLQPNLPPGVWLTSVQCEAIRTAPRGAKAKPKAEAGEGGEQKPAEEKKPPAKGVTSEGVPLHTGKVTIQGVVNGYDLPPLSELLANLQRDPYFIQPYLVDSTLEEEEESVVRSFELAVNVKKPEPDAEPEEGTAETTGGEAK